jgi:hypothetical protein
VTTPVDTLTALLDAAAKQFGISMGRRMVIWHREHADPGYSHNPEMLLETKIRSEADLVLSQIDNGLRGSVTRRMCVCQRIRRRSAKHWLTVTQRFDDEARRRPRRKLRRNLRRKLRPGGVSPVRRLRRLAEILLVRVDRYQRHGRRNRPSAV